MLCALGFVLAIHAASGEHEPASVRVMATAAIPILVVAGYFPLSRGGIATAVAGLLLYALLARPRRLPIALLAAGCPRPRRPSCSAYGAEALATATYFEPPGPDEGRSVLAVLVATVGGAALLRLLALPLERRLDALPASGSEGPGHSPRWPPRRSPSPRWARRGWRSTAATASATSTARSCAATSSIPGRTRAGGLSAAGNNGRLDVWRVGRDTFSAEPLHGAGAGTFQLAWERERPVTVRVVDGHSLYLETAAELGAVGLGLLALLLAGLLAGIARGLRGPRAARARGAARCRRGAAATRRHRLGLGDAGAVRVAVRGRRHGVGARRRTPRRAATARRG